MSYKSDVSQDSKYISQIYHVYVLVQIHILMDLGDVLHLYMNFAKSFCIFFFFFCVCVRFGCFWWEVRTAYLFCVIGNRTWRLIHPIFIGGFVCIRLEIFCSISEKSWRQFHFKRYGINPHLSVWIYFFALNFRLTWEVCNGYHNLDLWKNSFDPDIINMLLRTLYIDLPYYCCLRWVIHRQTQMDCMYYAQYTVYMCIDKTVLTEVIQQKQSRWS